MTASVCSGVEMTHFSGSSASVAGPYLDEEKASLATCKIFVAS